MTKEAKKVPFDPKVFLATVNGGRSISKYRMNQQVFSQGHFADAVFYIQKGKVKITVVSEQGKEAVVAVLGPGEFCGEGCLTGQPLRLATATAMTDCEIMRLEKATMIRVLHEEPAPYPFILLNLALSLLPNLHPPTRDEVNRNKGNKGEVPWTRNDRVRGAAARSVVQGP
jgi:CRP-like cAMP-binding protein